MEEERLKLGIVRILNPNGETAGTGFLAHATGLIATCAHVVRYAGAKPGSTVELVFDASGERRTAAVEPDYWHEPDKQDIAILRLEGSLPDRVLPLPLGQVPEANGDSFSTLGFPPSQQNGIWGYGTVVGDIQDSEAGLMLQLSSTEVTTGFSGAPVIHNATGLIVGMVSEITAVDKFGRLGETVLATPTNTLRAACPVLQLSDVCPYRGLSAFTDLDTKFFFGRQRVVDKLLGSLRNEPSFLAILGPSGAGKSSVMRAGLIPQLREGRILGSEHWGFIMISRYDELYEQLKASGLEGAPEGLADAAEAWLEKHPEHERLVLVMDQFERLFTDCPELIRSGFTGQLCHLLDSRSPITLVLVMQDTFYKRLAQEAPDLANDWLPERWNDIPQDYWQLNEEELSALVREPAWSVGLSFEENLDEVIINDVLAAASSEGEERAVPCTILPLLESALTRLWELRRNGRLTRDGYGLLGGLTGQLPLWADKAYRELGEELQPVFKLVLTDLVSATGEGQNSVGTPRKRLMAELSQTGNDNENVLRVVQRLTEARLLMTYGDKQSGQETVEFIHEALLRKWTRLRRFVSKEERRFLPHTRQEDIAGRREGRSEDKSSQALSGQSTQDLRRIGEDKPRGASSSAETSYKISEPVEKVSEPQDTDVPAHSGQHEETLEALDRKISDIFCSKGLTMSRQGRYEEAVAAFNNALSLKFNDPVKGLALLNLHRHEEALKAVNGALRLNPDDAVTWYTKGLVLVALGRQQEAMDAFKEAHILRDKHSEAWSDEPELLGTLNGIEEA